MNVREILRECRIHESVQCRCTEARFGSIRTTRRQNAFQDVAAREMDDWKVRVGFPSRVSSFAFSRKWNARRRNKLEIVPEGESIDRAAIETAPPFARVTRGRATTLRRRRVFPASPPSSRRFVSASEKRRTLLPSPSPLFLSRAGRSSHCGR